MGNLANKTQDVNDLGYFATSSALSSAYPVGAPGYFAIVGPTNTVWVWDTGTSAWVDSGNPKFPENAATITVVDDSTSNITVYPIWVTADNGALPGKVSSTKINFNPLTGNLATVSINLNNETFNNHAIAASSNAVTVPVNRKFNTVTNDSDATLTITMATAGAVDGQRLTVRVLDFSAAAQTVAWVNTENSKVSVPTTSNGSTTLPMTIDFQFNAATGKWRCILSV